MLESSSVAERAPTSSYYRWEIPGKPVSVLLSETVSDHVLVEGMRGLGLVPRRGAEVGGVLFGRVQAGFPAVVVLERAVTVESEYASGPVWALSTRDRLALGAVLSAPPDGLRPVGFYRTETGDRLRLSASDEELFREFFPAPESVALLVKPRMMQSSVAGFFIRENASLSRTSPLEFRVQPRQALPRRTEDRASAEERPSAGNGSSHMPAAEVKLPGFLNVPDQPVRARFQWPRWNSWWFQAPLIAILLAAAGYLGYLSARQFARPSGQAVQARNPYALSLVVLEYGDNLHLSWDREAPPVRRARRASLAIDDGGRARTLDLTPAQLRDGSVIYRRLTSSVSLKLEVFLTNTISVAESWHMGTQTGGSVTTIGP